ncbi:unnamed protein product [Protopolystoma xenopodis]|uniref:Uncharacterized protein n=1 Tax=Protopolystoma xenopodis TaxID=117903 RepID=A0A448XFQ5_9PLAT|nr:unnamed protein product [Protopolystoma xenopodis]
MRRSAVEGSGGHESGMTQIGLEDAAAVPRDKVGFVKLPRSSIARKALLLVANCPLAWTAIASLLMVPVPVLP